MTPRIKLLAIVFLGVMLLWQGGGWLVSTVFEPLNALDARVRSLDETLRKKRETQLKIVKATKDLKTWNAQSLPPHRIDAATLYQAWLLDLATKHKLASVVVSPGRVEVRPRADTYYAVPANVKAEGTLKQVCDFLYAFQSSGLLHRVVGMKIETTKHQGDPTIDVTLDVEGLALVKSKPRNALESADLKPAALKPRDDYNLLTTKNLFVRGYNGPPAPPRQPEPPKVAAPPKPAEEPFDAKEFVRLVASVQTDGRRSALLFDQSSDTRTDLTEGGSFKVAGLEGVVLVIADEFVRMQISKDTYEIELGQNLKEMKKLAAAAPAKPPMTPEVKPAPPPAEKPPAEPAVKSEEKPAAPAPKPTEK